MKPILVEELMNQRLMSVVPTMSLRDLVEYLRENKIHGALVRDSVQLVGVVSLSDVLTYLADEVEDPEHSFGRLFDQHDELPQGLATHLDEAIVEEVMTPAVFAIDVQSTVGQAAQEMADRQVQRLVVTRDQEAVGVLSLSDLVRAIPRYEAALQDFASDNVIST